LRTIDRDLEAAPYVDLILVCQEAKSMFILQLIIMPFEHQNVVEQELFAKFIWDVSVAFHGIISKLTLKIATACSDVIEVV
jgi:hypothetical protein